METTAITMAMTGIAKSRSAVAVVFAGNRELITVVGCDLVPAGEDETLGRPLSSEVIPDLFERTGTKAVPRPAKIRIGRSKAQTGAAVKHQVTPPFYNVFIRLNR